MTTTTLNNGSVVLARETKYGISPFGYANLTQARNMAAKLTAMGVKCHVRDMRRPFYIIITGGSDAQQQNS